MCMLQTGYKKMKEATKEQIRVSLLLNQMPFGANLDNVPMRAKDITLDKVADVLESLRDRLRYYAEQCTKQEEELRNLKSDLAAASRLFSRLQKEAR